MLEALDAYLTTKKLEGSSRYGARILKHKIGAKESEEVSLGCGDTACPCAIGITRMWVFDLYQQVLSFAKGGLGVAHSHNTMC